MLALPYVGFSAPVPAKNGKIIYWYLGISNSVLPRSNFMMDLGFRTFSSVPNVIAREHYCLVATRRTVEDEAHCAACLLAWRAGQDGEIHHASQGQLGKFQPDEILQQIKVNVKTGSPLINLV